MVRMANRLFVLMLGAFILGSLTFAQLLPLWVSIPIALVAGLAITRLAHWLRPNVIIILPDDRRIVTRGPVVRLERHADGFVVSSTEKIRVLRPAAP